MGFNVGGFEWWEYFIMPWMAGFVGWGTNVLALKMTFLPLEFVGISLFRMKEQPWGLFGWQGIIPTKAEKMASICFELMTKRLLNLKEIFERLDPAKFSEVMEEGLLLLMDQIISEVANEYMPTAWNMLPTTVRDEIIVMADKESNEFLATFMADMQEHIEDVLDIKEMTGIFLKRQTEVSETFARVICVEILHTKAMWDAILTGPLKNNFFAMLRAHSIVFTEKLIGNLKPIAIASMGATKFSEMKETIAEKICQKIPSIIDQSYEYTTEALDTEKTIRVKMQGLSPELFEGVLHPAFEEDELTLILVGGVLGMIVGVLQIFIFMD
eukprot:scaffold21589_cov56-Attheya_sp.AAC.1